MMEDGYYISLYTHIGALAHLHNVNLRHDQCMALWQKKNDEVTLLHYWEFERLSGHKNHAMSFFNTDHASTVINKILASYAITLNDINEIWGTLDFEKSRDTGWREDFEHLPYHNLCHFYSSILLDSDVFLNEKVVALAVDGGPDNVIDKKVRHKNYYIGGIVDHGKLHVTSISSPGGLWALMHLRYHLKEGSLMALGSASTSEAYLEPGPLLPLMTIQDMINAGEWFEDLATRIEALTDADAGVLFNGFDHRFTERENKISMVVKIVQNHSMKLMEETVSTLLNTYDIDPKDAYLSLSGGFALNCPTNSHLMETFGFKGCMSPPCVNDSGMALGIGLQAFHKRLGSFHFKFANAYHGNRDTRLDAVVAEPRFRRFVASCTRTPVDSIVDDILKEPVIWFDGQAEVGPRALGHRSLLADPRDLAARDRLNEVKQRQWWRPVAPIVLEGHMADWFEHAHPSPYMLHTFTIRPEKRDLVPAIAHLDATARVQTIGPDDNPLLYDVLMAFHQRTGVPILCNTSLNDRGEPIIDALEEVLNFALRKRLATAYVDGVRVALQDFGAFGETGPAERHMARDFDLAIDNRADVEKSLNPGGLSRYDLMVYYHNPGLHRYDPADPADAIKLRRRIDAITRKYRGRTDFQFIDMWHFFDQTPPDASGSKTDKKEDQTVIAE